MPSNAGKEGFTVGIWGGRLDERIEYIFYELRKYLKVKHTRYDTMDVENSGKKKSTKRYWGLDIILIPYSCNLSLSH